MKKLFLVLTLLVMTGCAGLQTVGSPTLTGFTYATMKQIENGQWTKEAVLKEVEKYRNLAETSVEIDTQDIINSVLERSGVEDSSDRFLLSQFLGGMQSYIIQVEVSEERFVRLQAVLDAVEYGARLTP